MTLGENILRLRKALKLSQEQLAEKVGVTRQTISNWELNETSPNPKQLKLLSKIFNISIDELLENDIKNELAEKMSNTEKLAGMMIRLLKGIGIILVILLVANIIISILFGITKIDYKIDSERADVSLACYLCNEEYNYSIAYDKNNF